MQLIDRLGATPVQFGESLDFVTASAPRKSMIAPDNPAFKIPEGSRQSRMRKRED
jgi:hypothetical protein